MILNDNGMSITPNVGAISRHLAKVRLRPDYLAPSSATAPLQQGFRADKVYQFTHKLKERFRRSVLGTNLFDSLGFTYLGPVDGHDVQKVEELLKINKGAARAGAAAPITKKGQGL